MELFRTDDFYIFQNGDNSLWCDRNTGQFQAKSGWDLVSANNPECLGVFYGFIGKVELHSVLNSRLMLIKQCAFVGELPGGHKVYKVQSITFLPLRDDGASELSLEPCKKHQKSRKTEKIGGLFDLQQKAAFTKTWGTIKSATNTIKSTTQQAAALAASQVKLGKRSDSKDRERFERRILEELHKIFTETDSFYFSLTGDLTNPLQRQYNMKTEGIPLWKRVDDRFFWNRNMLDDVIKLENPRADFWIVPIIQGFVQIEQCQVEVGFELTGQSGYEPKYEVFTISLISRRSRFRAGTRYKRRGVDESGKCANYVETEQIISHHHHLVSFVQVRGSVPIFWSQPGYKYRPPPRLDKGEAETQVAFEKHFEEELSIYGPTCIISLIEQAGKEKIVGDAYTNHVFNYNSPDLTYVTFDFHEYCRGMHFENVSVLVANLVDVIREMKFCWIDKEGPICSQKGVFRVNCIDCLDRTNVVQTAIAKAVMEIQFSKLGLIPPEGIVPANIRNTFQLLWANNGDTISKQYAGTNALKGDYTRTGERKFTGLMKDGMNSANRFYLNHFTDCYRQAGIDIMLGCPMGTRELEKMVGDELQYTLRTVAGIAQAIAPTGPPMYMPLITLGPEFELAGAVYHFSRYYLNRFKDVYRQATIDLMLGNPVSEDVFSQHERGAGATDEEDAAATAEHVKLLIEDCKKMLISDSDEVLGAWGLIDADPVTGDPEETEMDTILILARDSYYVAEYDEHIDRVTKYQRVLLEDLELIEFGPGQSASLFKQSKHYHCFRLNYRINKESGYFHMFRSTNLRFFNNMAVVVKTEEEMMESLKAICEAFAVALEIQSLSAPLVQGKLEKKRSKQPFSQCHSRPLSYFDFTNIPHMTRNVSETQLLALKNVGTKAITNMTSQFNKLNKLTLQGFHIKSQSSRKEDDSDGAEGEKKTPIFSLEPQDSGQDSKHSSPDDFAETMLPPMGELLQDSSPDTSAPLQDMILPSCGIVMAKKGEGEDASSAQRHLHLVSSFPAAPLIDEVSLGRVVQLLPTHPPLLSPNADNNAPTSLSPNLPSSPSPLRSLTPEIMVEEVAETNDGANNTSSGAASSSVTTRLDPPNTLQLGRKLSRSSGDVDNQRGTDVCGGGEVDESKDGPEPSKDRGEAPDGGIGFGIKASQSESALRGSVAGGPVFPKGFTEALTSPSSAVAKELVLAPFSKLAKGMQNLGANLDPRKLRPVRQPSPESSEEYKRLQEKWKDCRTRLIAL
ncbi:phosphatidylinositide phosphatase SAC2 isoform X1 [Ischnura elegans]|uniref:phosphatidylinositide phosphatase SAC2 isoform X1 n=1 Tax=Ischnura elegans TaxID=197161 RepID=UPI001ED87DAC|nr:phosphatidylinositide phosphatase SAC2 isoform X1 [Ischnura elegans]